MNSKPEYLTHRDERLGIDRRQRLAAAQLLLAVDLPLPMDLLARQMLEAAGLMDGQRPASVLEIDISTKRAGLVNAARMIDEILADIDAEESNG